MPTPRLLSLTRAKRLLFKDWAGEYQRSADLVPQADEIDDYPRLERTLGQIDALTRSLAAHAGAAQVQFPRSNDVSFFTDDLIWI